MNANKIWLNKMFVTVGYSGLSPKAPGTVGSVVALVMGWAILEYLGLETLGLMLLLVTIMGFKEITLYEQVTHSHDSKEIVIDELIGMWLALLIAHDNVIQMGLAFVAFRVFDIWKPSVIGKADKLEGSIGVILDDILAGFFGGIASVMLHQGLLKIL